MRTTPATARGDAATARAHLERALEAEERMDLLVAARRSRALLDTL